MRILVLFVAFGLAAMVGMIGLHLIKAERRGYEACVWWDTYIPATLATYSTRELALMCLWLITTWPKRLVDLSKQLPELYDLYELKLYKRRKASR